MLYGIKSTVDQQNRNECKYGKTVFYSFMTSSFMIMNTVIRKTNMHMNLEQYRVVVINKCIYSLINGNK